MLLRILISLLLVSVSGLWAATSTVYKKWHPGFYIQVGAMDKEGVTEDKIFPRFRGVQVTYKWNELEPTKDQFDFSVIDKDLEFLSKHGKQLVLQIQTKAFGGSGSFIPSYLSDAEYGISTFKVKQNSFHPVMWNPLVVERLKALYVELGKRYDLHPNVEIVNLPETAPSIEQAEMKRTGYSVEKYAESLKINMQNLKNAFPNTVVIQFLNYPTSAISTLAAYMKGNGIGLGGPDITPYNRTMTDPSTGIYRLYPDLTGTVPTGAAVQNPDYTWKRSSSTPKDTIENEIWRTGEEVSSDEIYLYARDTLKVNYIFWNLRKPYFEHLLEYMKSAEFPKDEACGLAATQPK